MTNTSKTMNWQVLYSKILVFSVSSVAINYLRKQRNLRLKMKRSTFVKSSLQIHSFLKKQTQFYAFFGPKTAFCQIQTQFKANLNPIQTQSCLNSALSAFSAVKTIPFYAKRTQTFPLSAQKPRFSKKQTQNEPKQTQITGLPK